MGLPRSTFYDVPAAPVGDVALVSKIVVICDEFETYGYRRVRYRGLARNGLQLHLICIAINLRRALVLSAA